jgi:hypothetical protein
MYFRRTALVEELRCLPKLCPAYDRVIDQKKSSALDQIMHRDQLHLGDQIPLALYGRHERSGPCRRVFDKGPGKRQAGFIGITNGMSRPGIRYPGHDIRLRVIPLRQHGAAVVAHLLHADSLIGG